MSAETCRVLFSCLIIQQTRGENAIMQDSGKNLRLECVWYPSSHSWNRAVFQVVMCRWQRQDDRCKKNHDQFYMKMVPFDLYQNNADTYHKNIRRLGRLLQLPDVRKDWDATGIHDRHKSGNPGWKEPFLPLQRCNLHQGLYGMKTVIFMHIISRTGTGLCIKLKP